MKTLSCRDLGTNCDFVATGESNEEVINKMMEHATKEHKNDTEEKNMSNDDMKNMMLAKIKES